MSAYRTVRIDQRVIDDLKIFHGLTSDQVMEEVNDMVNREYSQEIENGVQIKIEIFNNNDQEN